MSDGKYTGPASGASLIGVKVLDKNGGGRLSAMLKGIAWCIKHKEEYNIRIISLSLGAKAYDSYRDDPLSQAVQSAGTRESLCAQQQEMTDQSQNNQYPRC